jgi:hypothetical protein
MPPTPLPRHGRSWRLTKAGALAVGRSEPDAKQIGRRLFSTLPKHVMDRDYHAYLVRFVLPRDAAVSLGLA